MKRGITIIYTILILSIALTISAHIFTTVLKETRLSALGRDSQFAIYAAESGLECALYWDIRQNAFKINEEPTPIDCAGSSVTVMEDPDNIFSFALILTPENYQVDVVVDKTDPANPVVTSRGYNTDDTSSSRRVERGLRLSYQDVSGGESTSCLVDLGLNLDHTESVRPAELQQEQEAAVEILNNLELDADIGAQVAYIRFRGFGDVTHGLSSDKVSLQNSIETTQRLEPAGGTNITGGMIVAHDEIISSSAARPSADKSILIITDGAATVCSNPDGTAYSCNSASENPTKQLGEKAAEYKAEDFIIIAVGIGDELKDLVPSHHSPHGTAGRTYEDVMRDFVVSEDTNGDPLYFPLETFDDLLQFVEDEVNCEFFGRRLSDFEREEI